MIGISGIKVGMHTCKTLLFPLAYEDIITKYSNDNKLDKYLVMAVIKTESNFIPDAHSGKAAGLMQLTEETAKWVSDKMDIDYSKIELNNPKDNIRLGCYYLRYLIDLYDGNIDVALAAYNGGLGNVNKWLSDTRYSSDGVDLDKIPFKETREYVKKVNKQWVHYKKMYDK